MVMTSKFNGRCKACGVEFPAGTQISWSKGYGATHVSTLQCDAAKTAREAARPKQAVVANAVPVVSNGSRIATFIRAAKDRGLKFPKTRFLAPDASGNEMVLSLAPDHGKNPGAVYVKIDGEFFGMILTSGEVRGKMASRQGFLAALDTIAENPAAAAKAYGALKCRCSFCGLQLTDEGSVEVGYGPICAGHYGLPHTPKGTKKLTVDVPVGRPGWELKKDALFDGPAFEEVA